MFFGMASLGIPDPTATFPTTFPTTGGAHSGFDWGSVITQGFNFGTTFIQSKYAKDAARYTGTYSPTGGGEQTYQPLQTQNQQNNQNNPNPSAPFSLDKALGGIVKFIQQNIVLVGLGLGGYVLLKKDPNKR